MDHLLALVLLREAKLLPPPLLLYHHSQPQHLKVLKKPSPPGTFPFPETRVLSHSWIRGKTPIGETFLNNPDFTFKKLCVVVPKVNVEALVKFPSSTIYQQLVVDLAKAILFYLTLSSFLTPFIIIHHFLIFPCVSQMVAL